MIQSQELERLGDHSLPPRADGAGVERHPEEDTRIILLAGAATGGDENAFAELYDLLAPRVFNLVLRSVRDRPTAEDVCQEIWLRVHAEIPNLRAPEATRSWLYRIASHACIDFSRSSRGKHRKDEDGIDEFMVAYGPQPEDTAILGSEVRMVWETLGSMAPRQSIALYLRQVDGLSYDEIASVLDCTRPTVEALLFRARQSFVRTFNRAESSQAERCEMFSQVMAAVIDDEPTALQRSALESHAHDCAGCRAQIADARWAIKAYLALPLLPVGPGLALHTIVAGGTTAAGAGIFTAAAGLLGAGAFQAKLVLVGAIIAVAGGAIATGQVEVPVVPVQVAVLEREAVEAGDRGALAAVGSRETTSTRNVLGSSAHLLSNLLTGTPTGFASLPNARSTSMPATPSRQSGASESTPVISGSPNNSEGETAAVSAASQEESGTSSDSGSSAPSDQASEPGLVESLLTPVEETLTDLTTLAGDVVEDVAVTAGDTVNAVVEPVATLIDPVDNVVEDLTGLSVTETLDDVTNVLPSSDATPVPAGETAQDVVEPVTDILPEDPEGPVEDVVDDTLDTVDDPTQPILGPPPGPPTPPPPASTPPPAATPPPAQEEEDPCLLGLLLC
jgi:RNA polymerase sigma-70 factor (ECF subfamily)